MSINELYSASTPTESAQDEVQLEALAVAARKC